jgi:hypothetical protein
MKNRYMFVLGLCILTLFAGCGSKSEAEKPQGNVILSRDLPDSIRGGENFTATLTMVVNGSLTAVGVVETYPAGWKVSGIPLRGVLRNESNNIEWIFWSLGEPIINRTFNYTVTAPAGYKGAAEFSGVVISRGTHTIDGDTLVNVSE